MPHTKYTYPTQRVGTHDGKGFILNHDHFLFMEQGNDFSYQHNSRGLFQFIEGTYDLRDVPEDQKVIGLMMLRASIEGIEAVAWIEHTSNWDGFVEFTLTDGRSIQSTWDFHLLSDDDAFDPSAPVKNELFPGGEKYNRIMIDGFEIANPDGSKHEDWEGQIDFPVNDVVELQVWFDT